MEDIRNTIRSYENECEAIKMRINELHRKIARAGGENAVNLCTRRYILYTELWDMEFAIREMREYAESMESREMHEYVESMGSRVKTA